MLRPVWLQQVYCKITLLLALSGFGQTKRQRAEKIGKFLQRLMQKGFRQFTAALDGFAGNTI